MLLSPKKHNTRFFLGVFGHSHSQQIQIVNLLVPLDAHSFESDVKKRQFRSFKPKNDNLLVCLFVECKKKSVCVTISTPGLLLSFTLCRCVDFNIERTNSKEVPEYFELQSNFGSFIFVLLSLMFQWRQYKEKRRQFAVTRIRPRKKHTNHPHGVWH